MEPEHLLQSGEQIARKFPTEIQLSTASKATWNWGFEGINNKGLHLQRILKATLTAFECCQGLTFNKE